jgi:hypothetical protein
MRTALEMQTDVVLTLMPMLQRWHHEGGDPSAFAEIMRRFASDDDLSTYGLMNAVTSVARDTTHPQSRWRLEELGGGLLVGTPSAPASTALARSRSSWSDGKGRSHAPGLVPADRSIRAAISSSRALTP